MSLTADQQMHVRRLRNAGYKSRAICKLLKIEASELRQYYGNREPDETQRIDGELIGDRIKRITREIRARELTIRRTR